MTRPYAEVIGDPISHSKSPGIHGFWLKQLGIEAEYRAQHVTPEGLEAYFAARAGDPDWRGCNITIPHKQAAMTFAVRGWPVSKLISPKKSFDFSVLIVF